MMTLSRLMFLRSAFFRLMLSRTMLSCTAFSIVCIREPAGDEYNSVPSFAYKFIFCFPQHFFVVTIIVINQLLRAIHKLVDRCQGFCREIFFRSCEIEGIALGYGYVR